MLNTESSMDQTLSKYRRHSFPISAGRFMKNLKIIFELLKQVVNYKNIEKEMVSRGEDWSS